MRKRIKMISGNTVLMVGLIIAGTMLAVTLLGTFWTPYVPTAMGFGRFQPPSPAHIFGTDNFGRDIFSRILKGTGTTLAISFFTVMIGAVVGTLVGAVTGYFGGAVDETMMRLNDALTAFPSFLLALLVVSLAGPGKKYSVILALGLVFIPSFARVMRTEFASLREKNYVTGARLMGTSHARILMVHLLPNTLRVFLPAFTIGFNNAVLAEASMSFLGIGVTPPDSSLGYMLSESQGMLRAAPWYAICTGCTIVLLIFGVGLIGEGIQMQSREVG